MRQWIHLLASTSSLRMFSGLAWAHIRCWVAWEGLTQLPSASKQFGSWAGVGVLATNLGCFLIEKYGNTSGEKQSKQVSNRSCLSWQKQKMFYKALSNLEATFFLKLTDVLVSVLNWRTLLFGCMFRVYLCCCRHPCSVTWKLELIWMKFRKNWTRKPTVTINILNDLKNTLKPCILKRTDLNLEFLGRI